MTCRMFLNNTTTLFLETNRIRLDLNNYIDNQLLTAAIGAIAFNASSTLDKKHGDNTPVQDIMEKVIPHIDKAVQKAVDATKS